MSILIASLCKIKMLPIFNQIFAIFFYLDLVGHLPLHRIPTLLRPILLLIHIRVVLHFKLFTLTHFFIVLHGAFWGGVDADFDYLRHFPIPLILNIIEIFLLIFFEAVEL